MIDQSAGGGGIKQGGGVNKYYVYYKLVLSDQSV